MESGRQHMALVCKKLATDATLDKVLCIRSGCRPIETCTEGLAYEGPSCGVVAAESSMNFGQELPPLFFGDTSLKDFGGAFLIKLSFVDFIGFRLPHYAACLILVLGKFLPS